MIINNLSLDVKRNALNKFIIRNNNSLYIYEFDTEDLKEGYIYRNYNIGLRFWTQILSDKNSHKNGQEDDQKQPKKQPNLSISEFPTMLTWNVYHAIKLNRKAKYSWLADNLGVSERTIQRAIDDLKELGYINKEHSKIKGEWQLLK